MADANARRQKRHDSCMATTTCPKCQACPGRECYEIRAPWNGHTYPHSAWQQQVQAAGRGTGKTMANTAAIVGRFMQSDWGRQLGGLHKERWAAWEGRSAVERLGELIDDD